MPSYGYDNSVTPGVTSEIYQPDQLIAGKFPIVTGQGTLLGSGTLARGTVLGKQTIGSGSAVAAGAGSGGANTGTGVVSAISAGAKAILGSYTVKYTAANAYTVVDPNGAELPNGANGAYTDAKINFTITAGGTAFVAGDGFTITLAAGSGNYVESVATATDGSQVPCAILADAANASAGSVYCPVYLSGEFSGDQLTYDSSWTLAALTAALQASNIYVRTTVTNATPSGY